MAKRPSLKDKLNQDQLTPEKIEAAYSFLSKTKTPAVELAEEKIELTEPEKSTKTVTKTTKPKAAKTKTPKIAAKKPESSVRITVDMPADLHEEMKILTIRRRETIRNFILSLVEKEVQKTR